MDSVDGVTVEYECPELDVRREEGEGEESQRSVYINALISHHN